MNENVSCVRETLSVARISVLIVAMGFCAKVAVSNSPAICSSRPLHSPLVAEMRRHQRLKTMAMGTLRLCNEAAPSVYDESGERPAIRSTTLECIERTELNSLPVRLSAPNQNPGD